MLLKKGLFLFCLLSFSLVWVGLGAEEDKDDENEKEIEVAVTFDQLPKAVQKTLKRESKGGKIKNIVKEIEGKEIEFSAQVLLQGRLYEIDITPDGTLEEKSLEADD